MSSAFNLEPKYWAAVLTREDRTKGTGVPEVKGLVRFTNVSKMR
jgi:formylmethanofuran dehydrogenase subunit D